jgi:hypothetical protein
VTASLPFEPYEATPALIEHTLTPEAVFEPIAPQPDVDVDVDVAESEPVVRLDTWRTRRDESPGSA